MNEILSMAAIFGAGLIFGDVISEGDGCGALFGVFLVFVAGMIALGRAIG